MSRLRRLGFIVALVAALLLPSGCQSLGELTGGAPPIPEELQSSGRSWVVLVDLSGSTKSLREEYLKDLEIIASRLKPGDRIVIADIGKDSIVNSRYLADLQVKPFEFSKGATNKLLQEGEVAKYKREHPSSEQKTLMDAVSDPVLTSDSGGSDLLGAIDIANRELSSTSGKKYLVIFSDMLANGGPVNLGSPKLTESSAVKMAAAVKDVPKLDGVQVIVAGAYAKDGTAHFKAARAFWTDYFQRAGATLDPNNYGRQLPTSVVQGL